MKLYESTVSYREGGKEFVATVLGIRTVDHHDGVNGEPLLHLGFFAPVLDAKGEPKSLIGTHAQGDLVQFRIDVAHESHTFSEEANRKGLKGIYPGGRWSEIISGQPVQETTALAVVDPIDTGDASTDDGNDSEPETIQ